MSAQLSPLKWELGGKVGTSSSGEEWDPDPHPGLQVFHIRVLTNMVSTV